MHRFLTKIFATLAVLAALMATPAMAQATRTWVSGVGDDANPCSRTAPCKTFAGAISKTAAGGEINALDPGGFGAVTITKSITIKADGVLAGVLVLASNGIIINAAPTDVVVIDGLDIEGVGLAGSSINGINILNARIVYVRNTSIRGFTHPTSGNGIVVNSANKVALTVENSFIFNNNVGISVISPGLNGGSQIFLNNFAGIRVTGAGNFAEISNNVIDRTAKSLELVTGGIVNSYGDNVLSPGDAPIIVPKG
jgi:hypothetical protein